MAVIVTMFILMFLVIGLLAVILSVILTVNDNVMVGRDSTEQNGPGMKR